jgi:hypothetical protein
MKDQTNVYLVKIFENHNKSLLFLTQCVNYFCQASGTQSSFACRFSIFVLLSYIEHIFLSLVNAMIPSVSAIAMEAEHSVMKRK